MTDLYEDNKIDNREVKKRLLDASYPHNYRPSEELLEDTIQQFWFHDFLNSFISDTHFLDLLIAYLRHYKPKTFNRYLYYEFLFNQITRTKKEREELHRIAVEFESWQTDAIEPKEYMRLFGSSSWSIKKLERFNLAHVKEKEGKPLLIWSHHTLTEFLTAEHILQQDNFLHAFEYLAILNQEGITAFKPSWSGVLLFLLQSSKSQEILKWLITFLKENSEDIDDNILEILTFPHAETPALRQQIFNLVYDSYSSRLVWITGWVRKNLVKFIDKSAYELIKTDVQKNKDFQTTFIKRGNAVSLIDELLQINSELISQKDKDYWKKSFVQFSNDPQDDGNGVLQRHSLSALANFKDPEVLSQVEDSCYKNTTDSLVKNEFLQLCYATPESETAIKHFILGIKDGEDVYARPGIYLLKAAESLTTLLRQTESDAEFWIAFFRYAQIYDKEDGDLQIIKNLSDNLNREIVSLLKKNLFFIFRIERLYHEERSTFIKKVVSLIQSQDGNFLDEVLEEIKSQIGENGTLFRFFDYEEVIAQLLTPENVESYFSKISEILTPQHKHRSDVPIFIAKRINGEIGNQVYEKCVSLNLVQKVDTGYVEKETQAIESDRKTKIYSDFQSRLGDGNRYRTDVFSYFLSYKNEISDQWTQKESNLLIKYAVNDGIERINPQEFKVSIPNKDTRQFTWSSLAAYYGDILRVVKELAPEKIELNKQKIIDFIPYAFSTDSGTISDFVPKISDKDLTFVNDVMRERDDDRRYLVPSTYIHLIKRYSSQGCKLPSTKPVLLSFLEDPYISDYDKESALEAIELVTDRDDEGTKQYLLDLSKNFENEKIGTIANSLLISVYGDSAAINWRFEKLKRPMKFNHKDLLGEAHSVGPEEHEIDSLDFAKPLVELKDEKYLDKFLELLKYSLEFLQEKRTEKEEKDYWDYVNYLWRIVITYVENLNANKSLSPLKRLETWIKENANYTNANWLNARVKELRKEYINYLGRQEITYEQN